MPYMKTIQGGMDKVAVAKRTTTNQQKQKMPTTSRVVQTQRLRSFNQLAFRTTKGGVALAPGATKDFSVTVMPYVSIRVLLDNRSASSTNVTFNLIMIQPSGGLAEGVGVLDTVTLAPGQSYNRVFDVPGIKIDIEAIAAGGTGTNTIDAFVYGLTI